MPRMCVHSTHTGPQVCSLGRKLLRKSHWISDKEEQGQSQGSGAGLSHLAEKEEQPIEPKELQGEEKRAKSLRRASGVTVLPHIPSSFLSPTSINNCPF